LKITQIREQYVNLKSALIGKCSIILFHCANSTVKILLNSETSERFVFQSSTGGPKPKDFVEFTPLIYPAIKYNTDQKTNLPMNTRILTTQQ